MNSQAARCFADRSFSSDELSMIREVVRSCAALSRAELAATVCELLDWRRPSGQLKKRECRDLLEALDDEGYLTLPGKRTGRPQGSSTSVPCTSAGDPGEPVKTESLREVGPVYVERIDNAENRSLFRELIGRHHYLGYRVPFGAVLRYMVWISTPKPQVVGVMQFSSPAWRMAERDRWIGWSDDVRQRNLQRVVSQSRFLILPWIHVKNLASAALTRGAKALRGDWPQAYAVEPLLLETLVDHHRYRGTCYRAANWIELGQTRGRGRMDSDHALHGHAPKTVFVYPLTSNATARLRGERRIK